MMVLSDGVLGMKGSLELVGDAAAATGKPVEQVGEAVAKAYAMIRDGQPVSRAANELRNMGLITPEVAASLKSLQESGASNIEVWEQLEGALKKYEGAMADAEETGNGMIGSIQSQWDEAIRDFGEALWEVGRDDIKDFLGWLKKIREDGSMGEFADNVSSATRIVIRCVKACVDVFNWFKDGITESWSKAADFIGALVGGASIKEAWNKMY